MPTDVNASLIQYLSHESSIIFLIIEKDGTILKSNKFADQITGKQLTGMHYSEIFIKFGKAICISDYLNQSEEKTLVNVNTFSSLPESFYFKFYDQGNAVLALGESNSHDNIILQKNLLELNQELNNLSRELQKKNAEMKKLNELKNEFLGIAAHDLRNPIGIILGYSEFLIEDIDEFLSADQKEMLQSIQSSCQFMLHLLNELLDVSIIESGKLNLEKRKVNIVNILKNNLKLNSVIAQKKNISIQFNANEIIPIIEIDPEKIEQVMNNLISNALKFSLPQTKINVNVFLTGEHVTISVTDQGPGIPKNEIKKLFKTFTTTSVKSTGGEKSAGLGLSIVRNIVMGHKGKIWVDSRIGIGSTFYFSLPLSVDKSLRK